MPEFPEELGDAIEEALARLDSLESFKTSAEGEMEEMSKRIDDLETRLSTAEQQLSKRSRRAKS